MDILIIGQSNAFKFGNPWVSSAPGVTQWTSDSWQPASSPGVAALGNLLTDSLGEEVRIVRPGVVGTITPVLYKTGDYIANWLDDSVYNGMLAQLTASGAAIDAVIWMQGEWDAIGGVSSAEYEAALGEFFARLRSDIGEVPVFIKPLSLRPDVFAEVRAAQLAYAASDPLTHIVEPAEELGGFDINHYTLASCGVLGDAFARAMLDNLGITPAWQPTQGSGGADTLNGSISNDLIYAAGGGDTISGRGGEDILLGEAGADLLTGGNSVDLIAGGSGADTVRGSAGQDGLFGDEGDDVLRGGSGADTLHGGTGMDVLTGDEGDDVYYVEGGDRVRDFTPGEDLIALNGNLAGGVSYLNGRVYAAGELLAILTGAPALEPGDWLFY